MTKRLFKKILPLLTVLLLAPWPVAYAYDGQAAQETIQVQAAGPESAPGATAFTRAIGSVTPGDLFYIDVTGHPADIAVTLYLTNTEELVHCYRYMTLKVGCYTQTGANQWEKAAMSNGELAPAIYITMLNGQVRFNLAGYAKYKVSIDSGCFYCTAANTNQGMASPRFYLTVD